MRRPLAWSILLLALAAVAVPRPLTIEQADHFIHPDIDVYVLDGPIRGVVNARQVDDTRSVRLVASLHGLEPATTYRIVISRRPCSRADSERTRIVSLGLRTAAASDDAVRARRVRRTGSLRDLRSFRILVREDGRFEQRVCITGSYETGTGTLT